MTYQETIDYLFNVTPLFQNMGAGAYKEGLSNTHALDEHFGHPHRYYKTIHVAGTNGKGSCSHTLAAIFQSAGYRVGLYTSPHLVDFRERIRINGEPIPEQYVVDFVENERSFFEPLHPSFFELATAMAFKYFADELVDIAIVEVGLGGRLDCTNIIRPELCVITNISYDHTQLLGHTLAQIASEKAGIIKKGVPVVIGETTPETRAVFQQKAEEMNAPIVFAEDMKFVISSAPILNNGHAGRTYQLHPGVISQTTLYGELGGDCQEMNTNTLLHAIRQLIYAGHMFEVEHILNGFANVSTLTGLMGRWQVLGTNPLKICDTGHNVGGIQYITKQLQNAPHQALRIVIGMVNDKDITGVLNLLPKDAVYYFTQASVNRALPATVLAEKAAATGLNGKVFDTVESAYTAACADAASNDVIFVGGSTFIVADLLSSCNFNQ